MSEMEAPEMTTDELVDYTLELLATVDDNGVEELFPYAVQLARLVNDGMIDADAISDLGRAHLVDLYNDYENDGGE